MSLVFGANTSDRVTHPDTGASPTTSTGCMWVYITTATAGKRLFSKTPVGGGGVGQYSFIIAASNRLRAFMDYVTTDSDSTSANNVIVINTWQFFAWTHDNTNAPKIYVGDLTTAAAEVSYTTQIAPTGARNSDSNASVYVGNSDNFTDATQGRIARFNFIVGTALTLGEIRAQQARMLKHANSKILTYYGFNGTGSQIDWSGNGNHGTITGATLGDRVPLGPLYFFPQSPHIRINALTQSASDSYTLSDAIVQNIGRLYSNSDAISLSDANVQLLGGLQSVSDSVGLSDLDAERLAGFLNPTDSISFLDQSTGALDVFGNFGDAVGLADAIDYTPPTAPLEFFDTLSLTDTVAITVSGGTSALIDLFSLSDAVAISTSVISGPPTSPTTGACVFEFYEMQAPENVETLPVPKRYDQLGPMRFDKIAKIFGFRVRLIMNGSTALMPFELYSDDSITSPHYSNLLYSDSFLLYPGVDFVYEIQLPKSVNSDIVRLVLGPTVDSFHRYDVFMKIQTSGMQGQSKWVPIR